MRKRWVVKKPDKELQNRLSKELGISPVLAQLLINRNISTSSEIKKFLSCEKSMLHDPFLLKDMAKAVTRIEAAIKNKEKILIYGDYDADGITAVAILHTYLKQRKAQVHWYIPNRLDEGYGLNLDAAKLIKSQDVSLVIVVDCGTTDKEEVGYLKKNSIDTIIVDHHRVQEDLLPDAHALINPRRSDCEYPFKYLSAVGLAYKLVCALSGDIKHSNDEFLDFVALGTVADIVSQTGENRILTRLGLRRLSVAPRIGLKKLMEVAGLRAKSIQTEHIGFVIGPRINASGRIGSPELALRLILAESEEEAREYAEVLNHGNSFRQKLQEEIFKEALSEIERINFKDQKIIVVAGRDWHPGVIGIVASKIMNRFYRPAIVLGIQGSIAKGSGRSIDNFHLFNAVHKCRDLLESFGGHEAACGIKVLEKNIDKFKTALNEVACQMLNPDDLVPVVDVDMEVPLSGLDDSLLSEIEKLAPFGNGNPQPLFLSNNLKLKGSPARFGKNGLKMWVTDGKATCQAVCFNSYDMAGVEDLNSVDLVYHPKVRKASGISTFELGVEDIKSG